MIDFGDKHNRELNATEYEDIMLQFNAVDKSVLQGRFNVFNNFDYNKDGYIELVNLPALHTHIIDELKKTNSNRSVYPDNYVISNFNKNGRGQFNFLDFNKYMENLHLYFI